MYFKQRYYSQIIGRFVSADPYVSQNINEISFAQDLNLYSYANNNPIRRVDPSGLFSLTFELSSGYGRGFEGATKAFGIAITVQLNPFKEKFGQTTIGIYNARTEQKGLTIGAGGGGNIGITFGTDTNKDLAGKSTGGSVSSPISLGSYPSSVGFSYDNTSFGFNFGYDKLGYGVIGGLTKDEIETNMLYDLYDSNKKDVKNDIKLKDNIDLLDKTPETDSSAESKGGGNLKFDVM